MSNHAEASEPIRLKADMPHDDLYTALRDCRNTPDHLWAGSDEERVKIA
jgi:hypothetical protein